jgi:drug/metabolite transporter (DMT)-like permease
VAIAVLTFSTYPVFVTFLEPYFYKEKIRMFDIFISFVTLCGVFLIIPKFELTNNVTQGALWGLAAGLTCAFLAIACKKGTEKYSPLIISFYQNLAAAVVSLPFVIYIKPSFQLKDILLLVLLGSLFTAVSGILYIKSLTTIKVQFASIVTCLEPVYAIVLAVILLGEVPSVRTLIGGLVILGAILFATIKSKHQDILLNIN